MRRGVTLVELLVVLVLLGLLFTVSGLALTSLSAPRGSARIRELSSARVQAIRRGVSVTVLDSGVPVLYLSDGRGIGPGIDPLTGDPVAAR